ncbi:amino acid permease [Streptomyces bungoensis]|uniref:amino acid permease n=1 Tax=Streptomyces bungoensis TaxID=285568 RepID=UPI002679C5C5
MTFGLATGKLHPKIPRCHGEGGKSRLTTVEGLAALSLDALSSVAYGPEAIMVTLAVAGAGAITAALPITLVIVGLPGVLVVSYCQVIAVHPDGGGSYAVAKKDLGTRISLLAAAGLVVDHVLTVAVSLAAGAASLASAFPVLAHHSLAVCLVGPALLTAVNLRGVADSARVLMLPMALFVVSVLGVVVGLSRPAPAATVGAPQSLHATEALGLLLLLKAFSAGCSALTGIEAVANAVPMFRKPRVGRAQRTELLLGVAPGGAAGRADAGHPPAPRGPPPRRDGPGPADRRRLRHRDNGDRAHTSPSFTPGSMPHRASCVCPGSRVIRPSPELNASGAHVIGSTPRPVRRRSASGSVSPVKISTYG